jgi:hypothetical protein
MGDITMTDDFEEAPFGSREAAEKLVAELGPIRAAIIAATCLCVASKRMLDDLDGRGCREDVQDMSREAITFSYMASAVLHTAGTSVLGFLPEYAEEEKEEGAGL